MKEIRIHPGRLLYLYTGIVLIVSLATIGRWGLIESSEARYAEIAREMVLSGNWQHPELLGIRHYHKPPLTYWITAAGYSLFGINEFGARFFLVISYGVQIGLVFFIARKLIASDHAAMLSAVIYSSLPVVLVSVRGLTTDTFLTTFVLASLACWLQWRFTGRMYWLYAVALCLALAFLAKGPVVLLVPVLVMFGLQQLQGVKPASFTMHHVLAMLVFLLVGLSWFFSLVSQNNEFIDYFLFRHTLDRFAAAEVFKRSAPWWYYLAYAPLVALPWILVLVFRPNHHEPQTQLGHMNRLLITSTIIPFLFFSASSSKLVLYILPLFAGFTMWIAYRAMQVSDKQSRHLEYILVGCMVMFMVVLVMYVLFSGQLSAPGWLLIFITVTVLMVLLTVIVSYGNALERIVLYTLYFTLFLLISSAEIMRDNALLVNSTKPISTWLQREGLANRPVLVYNRLLPSLSFQLNKSIITLQDGHHTVIRETQFQPDSAWRQELFNLRSAQDSIRLIPVLRQPTVMIVRKEFQESRAWLRQYYTREKSFDPWLVLY